jgi:hypothetical protein
MVLDGVRGGEPRQGERVSRATGRLHITSFLNTGAGPSPRAQDRFVRHRVTDAEPSATASQSSTAQLIQRSTRRSPAWCSGRRPRPAPVPELVEQATYRCRVGDGDWVDGVEVVRAF